MGEGLGNPVDFANVKYKIDHPWEEFKMGLEKIMKSKGTI